MRVEVNGKEYKVKVAITDEEMAMKNLRLLVSGWIQLKFLLILSLLMKMRK